MTSQRLRAGSIYHARRGYGGRDGPWVRAAWLVGAAQVEILSTHGATPGRRISERSAKWTAELSFEPDPWIVDAFLSCPYHTGPTIAEALDRLSSDEGIDEILSARMISPELLRQVAGTAEGNTAMPVIFPRTVECVRDRSLELTSVCGFYNARGFHVDWELSSQEIEQGSFRCLRAKRKRITTTWSPLPGRDSMPTDQEAWKIHVENLRMILLEENKKLWAHHRQVLALTEEVNVKVRERIEQWKAAAKVLEAQAPFKDMVVTEPGRHTISDWRRALLEEANNG